MVQFLVKRVIGLLFVILCVTFITFIIGFNAPGNPIQVLMGEHPNKALELRLLHAYGLDLPWYTQYYNFLVRLLHFDLGTSFTTLNRPVWDIIKDGVPISAELGFWALIIQVGVGVPIGIISALKANSWIDTFSMGAALIIYALPIFVLGILLQLLIIWIDKTAGVSWPNSQWGTHGPMIGRISNISSSRSSSMVLVAWPTLRAWLVRAC